VHQLGRADDRIGRASLDAQRAADARCFVDERERERLRVPARSIERKRRHIQQFGQRGDRRLAAGRATVDRGLAAGDRFGIGPAANLAATAALRLRKQCVDPVYQGGVGVSVHVSF